MARSVPRLSGHVADGERGLLHAVHRDLKDQSFPLAREDDGDRDLARVGLDRDCTSVLL